MTQNKLKDDLSVINHLAELLHKNNLSEVEYNKTLSKDSSIGIKVKRDLEQNFAVTSVPDLPSSNISTKDEKIEKENTTESKNDNQGVLKSPMVGTVYLSPEPNSDPFVKVGDLVKEGQPVLIIEAMKTMNHIPANKSGTVKSILIDNASPVEFGDPLIMIE